MTAASAVPSYLAPTSSSAARTGRSTTPRQSPHSASAISSSPLAHSETDFLKQVPSLQRGVSATNDRLLLSVDIPTTPQEQQPPLIPSPSSRALPDSPEHRTSPSKGDGVLLYQSHSHVILPKPHERPILANVQWDGSSIGRTLAASLPWYERLRLDPAVALAVDPSHHDARQAESWSQDDQDYATGDYAQDGYLDHTNNNPGNPLLSEDAMVEIESVADGTSLIAHANVNNDAMHMEEHVGTDQSDEADKVHPLRETAPEVQSYLPAPRHRNAEHAEGASSSSRTQSSISSSASSTLPVESKLMQRARRYKQQQQAHPSPSRRSGTPTQEAQPPSRRLPDPPTREDVQLDGPSSRGGATMMDLEIPTAVSDLTTPSVVNETAARRATAGPSGFAVITRVLSPDSASSHQAEDDMDAWLDSALESQSGEHDKTAAVDTENKDEPDTRSVIAAPMDVQAVAENPPHRQKLMTVLPSIDLAAFAEGDEDNMEDWLDDQIT
jgi:hypothetical protein